MVFSRAPILPLITPCRWAWDLKMSIQETMAILDPKVVSSTLFLTLEQSQSSCPQGQMIIAKCKQAEGHWDLSLRSLSHQTMVLNFISQCRAGSSDHSQRHLKLKPSETTHFIMSLSRAQASKSSLSQSSLPQRTLITTQEERDRLPTQKVSQTTKIAEPMTDSDSVRNLASETT